MISLTSLPWVSLSGVVIRREVGLTRPAINLSVYLYVMTYLFIKRAAHEKLKQQQKRGERLRGA